MEEILHIAKHVLSHSIADTLYLIPFLFLTYLLMEWLEHKTAGRTQKAIQRAGAAGPIVGAVLGVVPQCGFSAVAAALWAGRVITLGTLFAVFLSTSDEMLPIFLAEQVPLNTIVAIMGTKVIIGMVMGFIADAIYRIVRRDKPAALRIHEICEHDNCHCSDDANCATCENHPELVYEHHDDCAQGCTHEHHARDHSHDDNSWKDIIKSAFIHTIKTTVFIFLITVVLNAVLEIVGEDVFAEFISANPSLSVFVTSLVGLVPNCAASIVIAQLYVEGVLGAGAMLSGLLVSAGVGLLVLVKSNRHWKQNVVIIVALYVIGVVWGLIVNLSGIVF